MISKPRLLAVSLSLATFASAGCRTTDGEAQLKDDVAPPAEEPGGTLTIGVIPPTTPSIGRLQTP